MKKSKYESLWAVLLLSAVLWAVPRMLNYQGTLSEGGNPVSGTRAVGYRLYRGATLVWEQLPADVDLTTGLFSDELDFSTGYLGSESFSTVFGSATPCSLEVYIGPAGTTTFAGCTALSPKERLLSTPYAFAVADGMIDDDNFQWGFGADSVSAADMPYDSSLSHIKATDVQNALDEVAVGNANYIWNQDTSAQSADFYITGDGKIEGDLTVEGQVQSSSPVSFADSIDMNNLHIINLSDPNNPQDAATKGYVDAVAGGGGFQQLRSDGNGWLTDSVTLVSGTNITLSQTGDSITISSSDNYMSGEAAGGDLSGAYPNPTVVWDTLGAYADTIITNAIYDSLGAYFDTTNHFVLNQNTTAQSANFWIDATGRVGHLIVDSSAVINESGGNYDFRIEGDTDQNLLFTDASSDMVGIGTDTPTQKLELNGAFRLTPKISMASTPDTSGVIWVKQTGGAPDTVMFWDDQNHMWLAVCPPRANPKCQVYGGGNTDCNPGPLPVPFANETRVDNGFSHDNALNPSRVYVSQDGYYKITYQIAFNNTINNRVDMHTYVRLNGATNIGGDGYCYMRDNTNAPREVCNGVVYLVNLTNGDYVEIVAERYSGANGNTFAIDPQCWFMIERENVGEGAGGGGAVGPEWGDAGTFLYPIDAGRNIRPNVSGTVGEAAGRWDNVYSVDGNFSNDLTISGGINDGVSFGTSGYCLKTDGVGDIYWAADSGGGSFARLRSNGNSWLSDSLTLVSGTNIALTQTGDSITIASSTNWDTLKAYRDTTDYDFQRLRSNGNSWLYDSVTLVSGTNITLTQTSDSITIASSTDWDTLQAYRDTTDYDFQRLRSNGNSWLYDSLTILAGSNISLNQTGDTLTISSSGTPGGNFQRLRSDANPWLYDSTTLVSGTNITLSQSGNQITITSTGASQWTDGGSYLQPINVNRDIIPNMNGTVGEAANRWNGVYSAAGDFSGSVTISSNLTVSNDVTISGGINDGTDFGVAGYCLKTDGVGDIYWASDSIGGSFARLRSNGDSWLSDSVTLVSGTNITLAQTGDSITITSSTNWDTLQAYRDTTDYDFQRLRSDGNSWLADSATLVSGTNITLTQTGDSITIVAAGNVSGSGTATEVAFWTGASTIGSNTNLYWDNANSRLGIGTTTPNQDLSIAGSMGIIEGGVFPNFYTIFRGSDQTADIAYYLPPAQGATNTFLMNDGSGNLSWSRPIPEVVTILAGGNLQWRNMPAALTELFNATRHRTMVDLSNATQARITVGVGTAGFGTAELRAQYSTDQVTWFYLDGGTGPSVNIGSVGTQVSSWVNLAAGAQADVYIRVIGINGNNAADPRFGLITVQFR